LRKLVTNHHLDNPTITTKYDQISETKPTKEENRDKEEQN